MRPLAYSSIVMKIYTKTGDTGDTGLFGGQRVAKDSPRIDACGVVDELNAALGLTAAHCKDSRIVKIITRIQQELFVVGADIATPSAEDGSGSASTSSIPRVDSAMIERLEDEIDSFTLEAGELTNFILPGGSVPGAQIHLARCVCRRAERVIVHAGRSEKLSPEILIYINRLSDHLFELARVVNKLENAPETIWSRETPKN
jgi:cob(I)alamin adenosyltransferase